MKEYELSMKILNKKYVDNLIIALARQGYAPYLSFDNDAVCFQVQEDELNEINNCREETRDCEDEGDSTDCEDIGGLCVDTPEDCILGFLYETYDQCDYCCIDQDAPYVQNCDFEIWSESPSKYTVGTSTQVNIYIKNIGDEIASYKISNITKTDTFSTDVDISGKDQMIESLEPGEIGTLKPFLTTMRTGDCGYVEFTINNCEGLEVNITSIQSDVPTSLPEFGLIGILILLGGAIIAVFRKVKK